MRQYKDDLLASCLQLLLSLPNELVRPEFQALVPALQVYITCVYYISITIVRSYTGKYYEFVAICIVTSAQHEQQTSDIFFRYSLVLW